MKPPPLPIRPINYTLPRWNEVPVSMVAVEQAARRLGPMGIVWVDPIRGRWRADERGMMTTGQGDLGEARRR